MIVEIPHNQPDHEDFTGRGYKRFFVRQLLSYACEYNMAKWEPLLLHQLQPVVYYYKVGPYRSYDFYK